MPLTAFTDHETADLLLSWDALLPSSNGAAELLVGDGMRLSPHLLTLKHADNCKAEGH